MKSFTEKVYAIAKRIPRGRVSTYGAIARAVGRPRSARAVGNALNRNPFGYVPCHRVVRSSGEIGGYARGSRAKMERLRKEGVSVADGRIDLDKFGFRI
ncbi:MAG TPA: MGMT family protein [Candidatus Paceibacterota bacterium]|nr:MGMT family protein [Candidatus Paceibacterota bacterium]